MPKKIFVSHSPISQGSIMKFIEYNWSLPALNGKSMDQYSNNILDMFDFNKNYNNSTLLLNPKTGNPKTEK